MKNNQTLIQATDTCTEDRMETDIKQCARLTMKTCKMVMKHKHSQKQIGDVERVAFIYIYREGRGLTLFSKQS